MKFLNNPVPEAEYMKRQKEEEEALQQMFVERVLHGINAAGVVLGMPHNGEEGEKRFEILKKESPEIAALYEKVGGDLALLFSELESFHKRSLYG